MLMHRAKKLTDISPRAWEHPADKAALAVLKQTRGLEELVRMVVGGTTERSLRLLHISCTARVTENQFHRVKNLVDRVVDVMDWPETPEVFVANSPFFNAGAYGVRAPFIVLNSSVVKALGDDELYCVVAHEMGHIMSGHALYKTVLWVLLRVSLGVLPVAGLLVKPLMLALREWERKSELTADRAALLALQSEKENYELLMKIAGGEDLASMNLNDFLQQAWEYENQKGLLDGLFKLLNTVDETHPFPVIRLQELKTWADAGSYRAILSGDYPRRGSGGADAREDVREGYQYYKTELEESEDPILKAARSAGGAIGKATEGLRDALKDILKNG